MSQSGATVHQDCINMFNELKMQKKHKSLIFKLSDDNKEIVVGNDPEAEESAQEASEREAATASMSPAEKEWFEFSRKMQRAQTKNPRTGAVGKGPRYAVYDFEYQLAGGEGTRNKVTFIAWSPDDAGVMAKMTYASSKEALRRSLNGIAVEVQANDAEDLEWSKIITMVSKGQAN